MKLGERETERAREGERVFNFPGTSLGFSFFNLGATVAAFIVKPPNAFKFQIRRC